MPSPRLSVVIPTLNEAESLERAIASARAVADEVIVSDGGSTDGSIEIARRAGARVVEGAPGRGAQLNRGGAAASGEVLLFLHADSTLPRDLPTQLDAALAAGCAGGGALIRFDPDGGLLRFGAGWINCRTRLTRLPLGDQAHFVLREAFERLDGYRDWPILEDLDLMRRLKREHRIAVLAGPVVTSARRFVEKGVVRTIAINWTIWTLYLLGVSPHRLARLYRSGRPARRPADLV